MPSRWRSWQRWRSGLCSSIRGSYRLARTCSTSTTSANTARALTTVRASKGHREQLPLDLWVYAYKLDLYGWSRTRQFTHHHGWNKESLMITLSELQRRLYDFIAFEQNRRSNTPSVREMATFLGCCPSNVQHHLSLLVKKGAVAKTPRLTRSLHLLPVDGSVNSPPSKQIIYVPLFDQTTDKLCRVPSSRPRKYVAVDTEQVRMINPARAFAFRVHGNFMERAHILHGDLALLEAKEAYCNDVVVALVDGELALRRFVINADGSKLLQADCLDLPTVWPVEETEIQGVIVGLVRATSWTA